MPEPGAGAQSTQISLQTPMERLLRPRSVAIVGASAEPASIGNTVLVNLERFGYRGEIHLVSRSRKEINGRPCVPTIDDLPEGIDAVVLIVPEAAVLDTVAACARRKAGGVVVFAAGFAEVGEEGRAKQERLSAIARESGLAMLGPNCIGYLNEVDRVALTFSRDVGQAPDLSGPGVGLIGQSGGMTINIRPALLAKGLSVTHTISSGNEAVNGLEDFLEFLIDDEHTGLIALFVEQVRRPARFLELVARARSRGKPIVMLIPGRTARARQSALSHTGALAGNYAVMRSVLGREAVVLVDTQEELFDVTMLLARWPEPPVLGAGVVTNSGAFRGLALDFCDEVGLDLPVLEQSSYDMLKSMLPAYATVDNPIDMTTLGGVQPDLVGRVSKVMLDDANIGSLIVSVVGGGPRLQVAKAKCMLPLIALSKKPIAFTIMGDEAPLVDEFMQLIRRSRAPFFRSPERAMRAMARVTAYARALHAVRKCAPPSRSRRPHLPGSGVMPEYLGKRYLAEAGIRVPEGALARSADEAKAIAVRIGYPVAIKVQAAALAHKSDAGGVMLNIADEVALGTAWKRLHENIEHARPGCALEGVLVEQMAEPGLEMIIGARRDPDWGAIVMVGLGGVWTEALGDVRIVPLDIDEEGIVGELRKLKGARLLAGVRGSPPLDERAVARAVAAVAELLRATPEITEIDINPLVVYAAGKGAKALDALIVTRA